MPRLRVSWTAKNQDVCSMRFSQRIYGDDPSTSLTEFPLAAVYWGIISDLVRRHFLGDSKL
jgi:hypothetical protein